MTGVHFDTDLGEPVGYCEGCQETWPLTGDYWDWSRGVTFCRACAVLIRATRIINPRKKYHSDAERQAARRRTWRESKQRARERVA